MKGSIPFVEKAFDLNDWFVIGCIALSYLIIYLLPKRFTGSVTLLLFLFSSTMACMLDNSIGGHIFDLYDIMDGPAYTVMDFAVYFLYAPFGYFFIYFYDRFQFKGIKTVGYILLCSCMSIGFEWICTLVGVFHYKDSYGIHYSFVIYLLSQSATLSFYHFIRRETPDHEYDERPKSPRI
ncbi:hypothetical protein P5G65_03725 [Paenibacillus chondroitinus]|uniref:Uncharacterized protein n=1 Tax=Paenibacillus chondroitinus TaxID=59842 RepID=A0ABU6D5G9_9BACL|nr:MULTISPECIES: hypothetical protein [Paenibacillus]MCY9660151.1 hypothetical protein [Paenibacillus anseongense]MEB4792990.1 hypothetical protein [Paenibacillus chondroitinus]